jgi:pimeloyl-ACP methyl ester carboxylesterase
MATKTVKNPADFIHPLYMNRLHGRMLRLPAPAHKKREILLIYGHHSSLERWWGVIQELNKYGAVTVPDLPGFGGMDSFYKIGEKPTIDNLADYLAAFIKMFYKRRRVTIAGLSLGFVIVTRMLQRYPELTKKVDLLVSVIGFAHHEDLTFSKPRYYFYRYGSAFFARRLPAIFFKSVCLNPWVIRTAYRFDSNAKFAGMPKAQQKRLMDFEVYLWHANEIRTHMVTANEFLRLDNCQKQIDLPVWHVAVKADQYFDNNLVEQHLRVVFNDFHQTMARLDAHAPSIIADAKEAAQLFPPRLRQILNKS